jgi:hypothetical protein
VSLSAQEIEEETPSITLPKAAESARKQIPTDPKAAEEVAEFLAKNVPAAPLPAGSTKLDTLRRVFRRCRFRKKDPISTFARA